MTLHDSHADLLYVFMEDEEIEEEPEEFKN
jgi:hypothetical protein